MIKYLFLLCSISIFSQSAWVKTKGKLYTQLSYNTIPNYSTIFNQKGTELSTSRLINDQTIQLYAEYGLSAKTTLITAIPFKRLTTSSTVAETTFPLTIKEGEMNTLGNVSFAVRHKIPHKKYAIATQLQVNFPTAAYNANTGLRSGIDAYSLMPSVSLGKGKNNLFFQSSFGLIFRTNKYSNGLFFNLEGGKKFYKQLWVIPFINIVDSFADGNIQEPINNFETFLNLDKAQYGGFGIKLIEEIKPNFGVTAAVGGAFFAHLEAKQLSLNVGLYYKIKK